MAAAAVVLTPCPVCPAGRVGIHERSWPTPVGTGRSVWADEPLSCSRGCLLTPPQVRRLVLDVYRRPVRQLALDLEAAG